LALCPVLTPPAVHMALQEVVYGLMEGMYSVGLSQDDEHQEEGGIVDGDTFEEGEQRESGQGQGWLRGCLAWPGPV
jgi:hypothetical protein